MSRVIVRNYSSDFVTVYIARHGTTWRLGQIDATGDVTLPIPRWAVADAGEVYLVARPLAGRPFRSEGFMLPIGGTAVWTIEANAAMSHVMLRQ